MTPEQIEQERIMFESIPQLAGMSFLRTEHGRYGDTRLAYIWTGFLTCAEQKQPYFDALRAQKDELIKSNVALKARIAELQEALDTLICVVGLTAFKHESQRQSLQEAVNLALKAMEKV